jgi:hypothetical protein
MKIRSSVSRRDFSVEPAGYFNVLRPSTRFIASHLQRRFPYLVRQSKAADRDHADGQKTASLLQTVQPGMRERNIVRSVSIVLAAIAVTFIALWWIDGNLFAHHFGF